VKISDLLDGLRDDRVLATVEGVCLTTSGGLALVTSGVDGLGKVALEALGGVLLDGLEGCVSLTVRWLRRLEDVPRGPWRPGC
jgi:hypothetical protein